MKKTFKRQVPLLLKIGGALSLILFVFIYFSNQRLYYGLIFVPIFLLICFSVFSPIIVTSEGVVIYRILMKRWKTIRKIKKVNDKLFIVHVEGLPWVIKIPKTHDYDKLISILKEKCGSEF